jgi:hypothetical protein
MSKPTELPEPPTDAPADVSQGHVPTWVPPLSLQPSETGPLLVALAHVSEQGLLHLPTEVPPPPPVPVTLPSEALEQIEALGIAEHLPDWLIA